MKSTFKESKISLNSIHESILPQTPPWIIKKNEIIFELNEFSETKPNPYTYQEKFRNILSNHPEHLYVFMDGSKENNKTACAAVLNKTILRKALPMESSIFTAEVCAIDRALDMILERKHKKFIIFSVWLYVLKIIK